MDSTHPSHSRAVFRHELFTKTVDKVAAKVRQLVLQFPEIEVLVGCGNSSVPLLGAVCYKLGMPMLVVRKESDKDNHDTRTANGASNAAGYLFIDDLVDSGRTLRHVMKEVRGVAPDSKFFGAVLYASREGFELRYDSRAQVIYGLWEVDSKDPTDFACVDYCPALKRNVAVEDIGRIEASVP